MNTINIKCHPTKRNLILKKPIEEKIDVQSVEIQNIESFKCPAKKKFQCKTFIKYGHFTSLCYKKSVSFKSRTPKVYQLQAGQMYMQEDSIYGQSEDLTSSDESFCLQVKIQHTEASFKIPQHLILLPTRHTC